MTTTNRPGMGLAKVLALVAVFCLFGLYMVEPNQSAVVSLFGKYVVAAAASENVEGEGVGGLNKFFSVFYKVRLQSKKLKANNRFLYYLTKWMAILGLLWLIFW